jgi:hypothetical protein
MDILYLINVNVSVIDKANVGIITVLLITQ